ncbi:MAG: hypothetical protein N2689_06490, partial [Verrucomicrobiae bacterium]|nr:hypothetical protein [Verrucomicrobiae bacterium]
MWDTHSLNCGVGAPVGGLLPGADKRPLFGVEDHPAARIQPNQAGASRGKSKGLIGKTLKKAGMLAIPLALSFSGLEAKAVPGPGTNFVAFWTLDDEVPDFGNIKTNNVRIVEGTTHKLYLWMGIPVLTNAAGFDARFILNTNEFIPLIGKGYLPTNATGSGNTPWIITGGFFKAISPYTNYANSLVTRTRGCDDNNLYRTNELAINGSLGTNKLGYQSTNWVEIFPFKAPLVGNSTQTIVANLTRFTWGVYVPGGAASIINDDGAPNNPRYTALYDLAIEVIPVPEPKTSSLILGGAGALLGSGRKIRRTRATRGNAGVKRPTAWLVGLLWGIVFIGSGCSEVYDNPFARFNKAITRQKTPVEANVPVGLLETRQRTINRNLTLDKLDDVYETFANGGEYLSRYYGSWFEANAQEYLAESMTCYWKGIKYLDEMINYSGGVFVENGRLVLCEGEFPLTHVEEAYRNMREAHDLYRGKELTAEERWNTMLEINSKLFRVREMLYGRNAAEQLMMEDALVGVREGRYGFAKPCVSHRGGLEAAEGRQSGVEVGRGREW